MSSGNSRGVKPGCGMIPAVTIQGPGRGIGGRPDARSRETRWESGGRPVVRASPSRERWCVKAGAPPAAGWAAGGPGGAFRSASGDAGSLYLRDEEGECAASLVPGLQVEVVRAGGREDALPERHDQASL